MTVGRGHRSILAATFAAALVASVLPITPSAAQFVAPPPPPPVLPPNFGRPPTQQNIPPPGYRCSTPYGVCVLNQPGPLSYPCTCMSPSGVAIRGEIIP